VKKIALQESLSCGVRKITESDPKIYDLIVIGGGLAGICAAISAARLGCKTALIQDRPVLGGNSSSEIRVPVGGCGDFHAWGKETGIIEEIITESKMRRGIQMTGLTNSMWDLTLYDFIKQEKNIDLFLNTSCRKAIMKDRNQIKGVQCVQLGTEKEFVLQGNLFIDASGDGALAFSAGAKFRIGEESRKEFNESLAPERASKGTMGNSLMFEVRDLGYPVKFNPPSWAAKFPQEKDLFARPHSDKDGNVFMSGHWWIEVGFPYNTVYDNEKIRDVLLSQLMGVWDHIKNTASHKAENLVLHWVGAVPGKRESRRFTGDYILTENDVKGAVHFPDSVAYGGWFIDVHTTGGILKRQKPPEPGGTSIYEMEKRFIYPYSIPYRCLYSKNIKNLFMAGRNISVTHIALGTTRLMATCAVIGQAAGTAAYLCKKFKKLPHEIYNDHIQELQQLLLRQDCFIPFVDNEDSSDLARESRVRASSELELCLSGEESGAHCLEICRGQVFPVSETRIDSIQLYLENRSGEEKEIELHLCCAQHIWDYNPKKEIAISKAKIRAGEKGWIKFNLDTEAEARTMYWIWLDQNRHIFWSYHKGIVPAGVTPLYKNLTLWRSMPHFQGYYLMKIIPVQKPFCAENVLNGVARPHRWTNIWISDSSRGFPQWLELDFKKEISFNCVEITFDTDLNSPYNNAEVLKNPAAPQCVKDYSLFVLSRGRWKKILEVRGNYHRKRIHNFHKIKSSKLKLEITATNGSCSASVYEVRVYKK